MDRPSVGGGMILFSWRARRAVIKFKGYISPKQVVRSDPINLVFFGNAPAANVAFHLQHSLPTRWHPAARWSTTGSWPTPSARMYAHIDDTHNGGPIGWKRPDEELSVGPYIKGMRFHLRIYEGYVPDRPASASEPDYGTWSIAAVHREHVAVSGHIVHGWKEPQALVQAWFTNQPFVGQVYTQDMGAGACYQGYQFDGSATFIEILP